MADSNSITEKELYEITIAGLMQSVELLEQFAVLNVSSDSLTTGRDRQFLNCIKERRNTGLNPIAVYLKPEN